MQVGTPGSIYVGSTLPTTVGGAGGPEYAAPPQPGGSPLGGSQLAGIVEALRGALTQLTAMLGGQGGAAPAPASTGAMLFGDRMMDSYAMGGGEAGCTRGCCGGDMRMRGMRDAMSGAHMHAHGMHG